MDYIRELNALYHFMLRKKMPKSEFALLTALYMINNAEDWASWFCADNELLGRLTGGYSRESLNAARNGLKQKGRIDFRPGNRNEGSAKYHIIPFCGIPDNETYIKPDIKPDMKLDMKTDIEPCMTPDPITKQKQDIDRNILPRTPIPPAQRYEEFMEAYPRRQRRGPAAKAYCDILLSGQVSEEELVEAARNYAESCRITGTEERYVKYAANFLQEGIFEDFLPGRYTAPAGRRKTDAGRGMLRSDYGDISALEDELDGLVFQAVPGSGNGVE